MYLNDILPGVAAVWAIIASDDQTTFDILCDKLRCHPTVELFNRVREMPDTFDVDGAFRSLFINRTSYGGLLHAGPIGGTKQTGKWKIDCQYTPKTTISRLKTARDLLVGRTFVTCVDWRLAQKRGTLFIDPPYYYPGNSLYRASMQSGDHTDLANFLSTYSNDILVTYDDVPEIRQLYKWSSITDCQYKYSASSAHSNPWKQKTELIIQKKFANTGWTEVV